MFCQKLTLIVNTQIVKHKRETAANQPWDSTSLSLKGYTQTYASTHNTYTKVKVWEIVYHNEANSKGRDGYINIKQGRFQNKDYYTRKKGTIKNNERIYSLQGNITVLNVYTLNVTGSKYGKQKLINGDLNICLSRTDGKGYRRIEKHNWPT